MQREVFDGEFLYVFSIMLLQVYIGELEGNKQSDKSLVAVKHLLRNATEKDK